MSTAFKIWSCFMCYKTGRSTFKLPYTNIGAAINCQQNQANFHLTSPLIATYLVIILKIVNLNTIC